MGEEAGERRPQFTFLATLLATDWRKQSSGRPSRLKVTETTKSNLRIMPYTHRVEANIRPNLIRRSQNIATFVRRVKSLMDGHMTYWQRVSSTHCK